MKGRLHEKQPDKRQMHQILSSNATCRLYRYTPGGKCVYNGPNAAAGSACDDANPLTEWTTMPGAWGCT
jgi:hypothetical protein